MKYKYRILRLLNQFLYTYVINNIIGNLVHDRIEHSDWFDGRSPMASLYRTLICGNFKLLNVVL